MKSHLFGGLSVKRGRFFSVIDRMIVGDMLKILLSVLSVLLLLIVTRRFLRVLSMAIEGEISGNTIFTLLGLKIIGTIPILLAPAMFLSVLMVLGRMYRDNEMTILATSGFGLYKTFRAVFILVIPVSCVAAFLSMQALPWSVKRTKEIVAMEEQSADIRGISAGRFGEYSRGDLVFYVEEITPSQKMQNIFVQNRQHNQLGIIASASGYIKEDSSGTHYIVLEDGYRYEGQPGSTDYSVTQFGEYAVRVDERAAPATMGRKAASMITLWYSSLPKDRAEFLNRVSIPLGTLTLSLFAVPLARIAPRGGVYGNFLSAFLVYITYENLLRVSHTWVVNETFPRWVGIWWLYAFMLLVVFVLIIKAVGLRWIKHLIKRTATS